MIFICYRREDTKAEVTNLHRRLVERFGEASVFVDFTDIQPGEKWPDTLRSKLDESIALLVVIGQGWGEARFKTGAKSGRLRLDDPDDWVRQEICHAFRRRIRIIVVRIDDAKLPETRWDCELDRLADLEHALIRNQKDFERDFLDLCKCLENLIPALKSAAESSGGRHSQFSLSMASSPYADHLLQRYLAIEVQNYRAIQLPLVSQTGRSLIAPIKQLRIDLPLMIVHQNDPDTIQTTLLWVGSDVLTLHEWFRASHTNALLIDRAARFEDIRRDCDIGQKLRPGGRFVIVGDPGCGKTTLLQWITYHYAHRLIAGSSAEGATSNGTPLPANDWIPIMILCRELVGRTLPFHIGDLLRLHLQSRQFSEASTERLVEHLEQLLEQGRGMLLIDGLDEIPDSEQRIAFSRLLTSIANRFPEAPILVTSRVVGFQVVREELSTNYDHFMVGPLDRAAKHTYLELWSKLIGWTPSQTSHLVHQVCHSRVTAKLTDNVFLLAMIAQIQVLDQHLPGRRVNVYRRAVELMINRRTDFTRPALVANEVIPHLEFLAYRMRKKGLQRCSETEITEIFLELRQTEPNESVLRTRSAPDLVRTCIDSLGLLSVAGTDVDSHGFDRQIIQFFHQSFQEYFAGQAILHGRDGANEKSAVARLRGLLATIEIREREVNIADGYKIVETVIADFWQEAVRMAIAELKAGEADDAILMLLPEATTPGPEARARAVFALQCLADEPKVAKSTLTLAFDAAIDCLEDGDGFDTKLNTWMDEALAAVSESAFDKQLREHLTRAFIESQGEARSRIGCCLASRMSTDEVTAENARELVSRASVGLASELQVERVQTALQLLNRFYVAHGRLGFFPPPLQQELTERLLAALYKDDATCSAAMWALTWLTGAKQRIRGNSDRIFTC